MPRNIYQGWWIVAGLFVTLSVSSGFGFYNLSLYMNVLASSRGFAVADLSLAVSLFFLVGGVAGIGVARLIDGFDVRWVMIGGAALAGLALGGIGSVRSIWQLYLLYVLFGIGNSAVSIVTSTTLVSRWFPGPERSVALSVASTGLSMGGVLLTPVSAWAFTRWGLDATMPWMGVAFFVVIMPIALFLIRPGPARGPLSMTGTAASDLLDWSYARAVSTRFFKFLTVGYLFCMGAQVGGIAHLYNRAEQLTDYRTAAVAVQVLAVMSIVSRILGGFVVTRVPIRWFTLGNLLGQGCGLTLIALADSKAAVLVGAAVFGSTVGNLLMMQPLWLAEAFGVRAYSRIFSVSNAVTVLGVASGPSLLGVLFDVFDYRVAYLAGTLLSALAGVLLLAAGSRPRLRATPAVQSAG